MSRLLKFTSEKSPICFLWHVSSYEPALGLLQGRCRFDCFIDPVALLLLGPLVNSFFFGCDAVVLA